MTDSNPTTPPVRSGGRPNFPAYQATVKASFDAEPRMRRLVLEVAAEEPISYLPGQALMLMIPLRDGTTGRRDYTIRSADPAARTVSIDFLMHGETPGPLWARSVKAGDTIEIKGPRGRTVFDETADWHLMACDETGIPAMAHIIEAAPEGCTIHAFFEIDTAADRFTIETAANLHLTWVERNGTAPGPSTLMSDTLDSFTLPDGRGKAYLAGETSNVRRQRHGLVARGFARNDILSEGYWRPGRIGGHDHVDD